MSEDIATLKKSLSEAEQKIVELQNALSYSDAKKNSIVDNLLDAVVLIDEHNCIIRFNPAAEGMFGYEEQEVIGLNVSLLCPEPIRGKHDNYIAEYISSHEKRIIGKDREVMALRKDGSTFPILLAVNELWLDGKRHFTGMIKDITQQKEMERVKNEFISTVSHELRTPLTSIRGALGLIIGGATGDISPQHTSLLDIAVNNTERLLMLINDILDIEKIEAGKLRFEIKRIDLVQLIQQCIIDNTGIAEEYGMSYQFTPQYKHVLVNGDEGRLFQVITNLLSNAAKFSPHADNVDIELVVHDGLARITVTDYGMGIAPEFMPKLFDKFTQADSTDVRQSSGTGLGLSISKAIVAKHQGEIFAESKLGQGASFHIELPLAMLSSTTETSINDAPPPEYHYKILIVEDDPDIAELIKRILADEHCKCDIAYDTIQARTMLADNRYDAMTLDLILPGQQGLDFLSELESLGTEYHLPVIVISVDADNQKISSQDLSSVIEWIQKPIDSDKLIAAVTASQVNTGRDRPLILQVEDEQDVVKVVGLILKNHADIITARTLKEARQQLAQHKFNLALLDIGLPDGSGLDLLSDLKAQIPPVNAVIFSAQDVGQDIAEQVSAALVKSRTSNLELIETIKAAIK